MADSDPILPDPISSRLCGRILRQFRHQNQTSCSQTPWSQDPGLPRSTTAFSWRTSKPLSTITLASTLVETWLKLSTADQAPQLETSIPFEDDDAAVKPVINKVARDRGLLSRCHAGQMEGRQFLRQQITRSRWLQNRKRETQISKPHPKID